MRRLDCSWQVKISHRNRITRDRIECECGRGNELDESTNVNYVEGAPKNEDTHDLRLPGEDS